jgi:general secretion pathway protein L
MRNTLLLRPDSIEDDVWRWLRLGDDGMPQGNVQTGPLVDAAAESSGLRVTALVPGTECLLSQVQIPGRNRQKLLRAVPFALEEQLSDEVENLHFAMGKAMADGAWPVVVIRRQYMQGLLDAVAEAGLDVQQVVSELQAIPLAENEITVLLDGEIALVRSGPFSGYVADSENLGLLLAAEPHDEEAPLPVLRLLLREHSQLPNTDAFAAETQVQQFAGDPLIIFSSGVDANAVNLLQGAFSRSGEWLRILQPWRSTAALFLVGLLVSAMVMGIDYFRLSRESDQLRAEIEDTFRKAMPGDTRIVNPRVQLQQQLEAVQRGLGAGGGFLGLLARSGAIFKEMQGVEIQGVTFRGGRLDVDLVISNLQLLDELKQKLSQGNKLSVDIQSATTAADQRVQSRLRIQGSGA